MARIVPGHGSRSVDFVLFAPEIPRSGSVADAEERKREGLRLDSELSAVGICGRCSAVRLYASHCAQMQRCDSRANPLRLRRAVSEETRK